MFTALLLVGASLLAPAAAQAVEPVESPVQERIDDIISEYGGEQTAWNEITWNDGEVVFTAAVATATNTRALAAAATKNNCPSGQHCAFSAQSYGGDRLAFSACTSNQSLSVLGTVLSVANNRTGKSIKVYKGSTLLTTVAANTGKNVSAGATKLTCS